MFQLFQIKKYNVKQDSIKTKTSDDIDDNSKIVLSKNNGYHLKLFSNDPSKIRFMNDLILATFLQ